MKTGRNEPCPCGSGKKFKRCHGGHSAVQSPAVSATDLVQRRKLAAEAIRTAQQGFGRPIVSLVAGGRKVVSVGKNLYAGSRWRTFPDFLRDYIIKKLGVAWCAAENLKPFEFRHPIMQWHHLCAEQVSRESKRADGLVNSAVTGQVMCYVGLAYSLYLLEHNAELQDRLIKRLKDVGQFQGAYFETMVANILVRAGFNLVLEDETDGATKHCEFAAISKKTSKRYSVEAKMRAVAGHLGRTDTDGGRDTNSLRGMVRHLNDALAKPSRGERLIFLDLNRPPKLDERGAPDWLEPARRRLDRYQREELQHGEAAYVFISNASFHRSLDTTPRAVAVAPFGLGIPALNVRGERRITDIYKDKQEFIDIYAIGEKFSELGRIPPTFDGKLLSQAIDGFPQVAIGQEYEFPDVNGLRATVTSVTVDESKREVILATIAGDGISRIFRAPMTELQFEEYQEHGAAVFGEPMASGKKSKNAFELFEWLMTIYGDFEREKILDLLSNASDHKDLISLPTEELRMVLCERIVGGLQARGEIVAQPLG